MGSGSNSKIIAAHSPKGELVRTRIVVSRDIVEIGGWTFKLEELLFALGVQDDTPVVLDDLS